MMSFLAGSVSTLGVLVAVVGVWLWVKFPTARQGLNVLAGLAMTHVIAFILGLWWGALW